MKKSQIFTLLAIFICLLIYFFIPSINTWINKSVAVLSSLSIEKVIEFLRSYGKTAAIVSFVLMVLAAVLAPIPQFLITLSNAAIFGWIGGAALSWTSAMAGAALCFFIAKYLGRDAVEKIVSKKVLDSSDAYFARYGEHTILVCRLLPFVSFDLISYAAGLTNMKFKSFFIATGIGQLPATLVYSYFGGNFSGGAKLIFISLMLLFAISIIIYIAKSIYEKKYNKTSNN
ncbi:DedA family protein [Campylobacter sputorum subsp. bubulus]|uniref:TVP38/TMEM64 family membrane protein n=1 Tax=Campylobacter sputorum subsp. sputorum TaxID=32024 RepID=A0A381DHQ2_9BACT|nr:TVP38/TMEM64 family protein [Campylobacter sputorum]ASM35257.1 putative membrane protein, YdjX family (SNARE domain) [Campylobacter sputorum aubsp. sputorum RM3237]ASM38616.1 putative membrane protein, YdjX family (SNARE domain) [Campylobacter sputorum bv. paraureolyticus LMG 11764]KAB0580874.1 TVP38/TMEM64 family protein [Campylobacter sputorum subsp. sputorum]MDY6120842.1 TVP38/TMEM64 family protein [Campylobacter sputorum]QEL05448.1 YdjX family membrane protein (SNARE domain) [Campylobac